ncbi:hypothetical protein Tco_1443630, partial [Tanacetum coccineum]
LLPDDPYVAVRQAQLVDTDTEVPLTDEEFEDSEPSDTRTTSSYSSASLDSTTPLSLDHPLTQTTPTRASFHHRTARITVLAQPAMSPDHSARVAEVMTLSNSAFHKRYRSFYETPSPSPNLPVHKRYRGTSELILDTDSEGDELGDEDTEEDREDESSDTDDERERLEDEGPGLEGREEEAVPEGQ